MLMVHIIKVKNCFEQCVIAFIAFCVAFLFFFKRENLGWLDNAKQRKKGMA